MITRTILPIALVAAVAATPALGQTPQPFAVPPQPAPAPNVRLQVPQPPQPPSVPSVAPVVQWPEASVWLEPPDVQIELPDLSQIEFDLSAIELHDFSQIELPDLSAIELPDFSNFELPEFAALTPFADAPFNAVPFAAWQNPTPAPRVPPQPPQAPQRPQPPVQIYVGAGSQAERLYRQGRSLIEDNQYERALELFTRLVDTQTELRDAGTYWRAYSLYKLSRTADALAALRDFKQQFGSSRWLNDVRALEAEVQRSVGQPISADAAGGDEIKLMALRGLMQTDPEKAIPVIERMLAQPGSPRLKERALFVLSQSNTPRAREIVVGAAKGSSNPDVQMQAIRYVGMMGASQVRLLSDIYRETNDVAVKRAVVRSLGAARARAELLAVAKSEESAELRGDAVRQLGGLQASAELMELYRNEKSPDVRRRILESLSGTPNAEWLTEIARKETDQDLRRAAVRSLAGTKGTGITETLLAIYAEDTSAETRQAVLGALQMRNEGKALVELARKETNQARKRDIVQRLSMMRGQPEVTEYLLELLK